MLLIFLRATLIPACESSSPGCQMMYSACKLNKKGYNIQSWCTPFPILNQSVLPCLVLTTASFPEFRFLRRQVRWSGIPISLRIFQFAVIYIVKGFNIINEEKADGPLPTQNSLSFPMIQQLLAVWSLVPLPFLNSTRTSGSSRFTNYWSLLGEFWALLYWRVRWVQLCSSLNILWQCLSLGLRWKLTFSSLVATAEGSKFAGTALSQHHFLGFK